MKKSKTIGSHKLAKKINKLIDNTSVKTYKSVKFKSVPVIKVK